jgi:hypothetical protein
VIELDLVVFADGKTGVGAFEPDRDERMPFAVASFALQFWPWKPSK